MTITRHIRRAATWQAAVMLLAGCALQSHDPRPLDPPRSQAGLLARSPDDPAVRDVLAQRGIDTSRWPLAQWDRRTLTELAYVMRPEIAQARAERATVDTARVTAKAPRNPAIDLSAEHHSQRSGNSSSPWTLGLALDLALTGSSRRAARVAQADARLREADWLLAQRAWEVRAQVRDAHAKWIAASAIAQAWQDELALRKADSALFQKRLELGAVAGVEAARARQREADAARDALAATHAVDAARAELARAVGVGPEAFEPIALARADDAANAGSGPLPELALQRAALNDRLDVRAALERYAASDARLQLEIARQVPEFSIKPGYAWDQGDNRWSLGVGAILPLFDRNEGPIAEARAEREAGAARFLALQGASLAQLDRARLAVAQAHAEADAARDAERREAELGIRVDRRLAAGDADRAEQIASRLAHAAAHRRAIEADSARARALAALEDAVQRPLDGLAGPAIAPAASSMPEPAPGKTAAR